jgi:(3R)-3-hydroxyacyl-CoA dehydrogenase / 3a,7a,12a-trihydroxy-5b-cholest-24-enoyl-CoA hydratase / enoyl-CoA hydratase 2
MAGQLRFDNRVVVITGAGSGLGKAYALEFARRGAKVVVNDLGCSVSGEGQSKNPADQTVDLIKKSGGIAVPNYDSAEFGDKIIKTALDNFGRVDVVINNAGVLRDNSMVKISENDWDTVINFHLKSTFSVTKAAWSYMRNQKYGRIINTSSGAGLYGNFGQANYSSAKLGMHGFTQTLSKEGEKYNIKCNTIAPIGASRMTSGIFTPDILEMLSAEKVAPLVVYLAHESCTDSGNVFETTGGWVTKLRWQRSKGTFYNKNFAAEDIVDKWNEINSFDNPDYPKNVNDTLQKVLLLMEEANFPTPKL